jgi:hypothetical protein
MAEIEHDIRRLVARLHTAHFKSYLLSQGWEEKPSRFVDQLYFVGRIDEGDEEYELYLPASRGGERYHTHLMRAIYKLCGIEDREPSEIACDMLASPISISPPIVSGGVARLRVRNSDSTPLDLRIDAPARAHELLPGEAIELVCNLDASGLLEIERGEGSLSIRAGGKSS